MEPIDGAWFVPPENAHEIEVAPAPAPALAPVDADPAILLEEAAWSVSAAETCLPAGVAAAPEAPVPDPIPVPLPAPAASAADLELGGAPVAAQAPSAEARLADLEAAISAALGSPAIEPEPRLAADAMAEGPSIDPRIAEAPVAGARIAEAPVACGPRPDAPPVPAPGADDPLADDRLAEAFFAGADAVDPGPETLDPAVGEALDAAFGAGALDPFDDAPPAASEADDEPAWADALDAEAPAGPGFETPAGLAASLAARAATPDPEPPPADAPAGPVPAPPGAAAPRPVVTAARSAPRPAVRTATRSAHPVVRARVASVAARALAWTVDGAVLVAAVTATVSAAARVAGHPAGLGAIAHDPVLLAAALGLGAVLGLVYVGLFTAAGGQTFGARLAGIRILDQRGASPSLARAFARAGAAALGTLACLLGLVWVLLDDRGQALHDRVARTFVVEA